MSTAGDEPQHIDAGLPKTSERGRVQADLEVRLELSDRWAVPLLARFTYRTDDPYAVHLAFHLHGMEPVPWIFARELLTNGMARPTGTGDVRVWLNHARDVVHLSLESPDGHALLEVPVTPLARWLVRTEHLVPQGGEARFLDIDAVLRELLHETSPLTSGEHTRAGNAARPREDDNE